VGFNGIQLGYDIVWTIRCPQTWGAGYDGYFTRNGVSIGHGGTPTAGWFINGKAYLNG